MTRVLCLLTPVVCLPDEMAGPGGPGWPPALLSPAPDITEEREDLNRGEAGSLGLTASFVSDSNTRRGTYRLRLYDSEVRLNIYARKMKIDIECV